ncbi:MAG: pseudouridine synthase [Bacteriovorax sp.]|nr:pseudouridine synthase [Bacteriovorax sp.]
MKKHLYLAFNKPYGILSQFTSENMEETLSHFNLPKDVYACGRLDKDSEGLLLLTNDGALIDRLLNPKNDKVKTYWVQVEKIPTLEALKKLVAGVKIADYQTKPCKARIIEPMPVIGERIPPVRTRLSVPTCWIEIELTEGKNRQVRRMTAAVGFPTLRLIRKKIGKLELGDLLPGEFREINKSEII